MIKFNGVSIIINNKIGNPKSEGQIPVTANNIQSIKVIPKK